MNLEERLVNIDLDIEKLIDSAPTMDDLGYIYIRIYGGDDIDSKLTGFTSIKGQTYLLLAAIEMMLDGNPELRQLLEEYVNEILKKYKALKN